MRTNEPTEPQPWRPLGEKVAPPAPPPPKDKPVPDSDPRYGVVTGPDGRLQTTRNP